MYKCFTVEVEGYEKDKKLKDLGPFTVKHAMGRNDCLMFKEAIDVELYGHKKAGTMPFKLNEYECVFNQGDPLYETRFVLSRKQDGTYKARMVLRRDFQVFNDPYERNDTYETEWISDDAKRDADWAGAYVLSPMYRAKRYSRV